MSLHATKSQNTEDKALTEFDTLPNDAIVRQKTVVRLLACSSTTLWRLTRRGQLHPVKLSKGITGFRVGDIRKLLATSSRWSQ